MTSLLECFAKYGCDKGWRHHYDAVYEPLLEPLRELPITLLEVGVFVGASLSAWADYFPNAKIRGVDTFALVPRWALPAMAHPRVRGYKCDSTKETPEGFALGSVDVIIDDGDHAPESQIATFGHYFPLLKSGGLYFIEDVHYEHAVGAALTAYDTSHHNLRDHGRNASYLVVIRK
jgi:8-demethyl-8-alpha-L-rhamnosyltetracenomycin-C 2'-O-methyltransferase